jgi:rod shape-determining protein MreC
MRKLFDFFVKQRYWFLFILLEAVSFTLIYRNATYQRNVLVSSANVVTGYIMSFFSSAGSYWSLGEVNKELIERNRQLEMQLLTLQLRIEQMQLNNPKEFTGFIPDTAGRQFPFRFVTAKVVNNSISHLSNYITINKGENDQIVPGAGVISEHGVVGNVLHVSDHFAVVLPLLNPKLRLSCKLSGTNYFGSLGWNGWDARFAQLEELPRHVQFEIGDTIITSGYSAIFPTGIMVGTVHGSHKHHDDNFYSLEVELSTDFRTLNDVRVLINKQQEEQQQLEEEATK